MAGLVPPDVRERVLANGRRSARTEDHDHSRVNKLFTPYAYSVWLLS